MLVRDLRVKKTIPLGELDDYYVIVKVGGSLSKMKVSKFIDAICPPKDRRGPFMSFETDDVLFSNNKEAVP